MTEPAREESSRPLSNREVAIEIAQFLDSKRAESVRILDVEQVLPLTNYFVVGTGSSSRATRALGDGVEKILKTRGLPRTSVELDDEGHWLCIDYGEVVVHIFDEQARAFYEIERLWGDAKRIDFPRGPQLPESEAGP